MSGISPISVIQDLDVINFTSKELASGAVVGALYWQIPPASNTIDDLALALARHILNRCTVNPKQIARDEWFKSALRLIDANQPPLPASFPPEINIDRLLRWINPQCNRFLMGFVPELQNTQLREARDAR